MKYDAAFSLLDRVLRELKTIPRAIPVGTFLILLASAGNAPAQQPGDTHETTLAALDMPANAMPENKWPLPLVFVPDDVEVLRAQWNDPVVSLLTAQNYDALERVADGYRKSRAETADGTWHLQIFYSVLCQLPETASDAEWAERLKFLSAWSWAKPESITARVAIARFYVAYGWQARGEGSGNTVTDAGWRLFGARMTEARDILTVAKHLRAKCPMWWETMQDVALAQQWSHEDYDRIFDEAVAFEPRYTSFYTCKAKFLLPRWSGNEGDWQRFARESADKLGGRDGNILYARIGWRMHEWRIYQGFIRDAGYSWPRFRKGLEGIVAAYPDSLTAANELAYMSYAAHDRSDAKAMFARISANADRDIWNGDYAKFFKARDWAMVR